VRCLIDRYRVIPDFRPPNLLRLGVSGLYTSRQDVDAMLNACVEIIDLGLDRDSQPPTDTVP
jgi:kynureninase